ncbi:MAG: SipW-dependent-type signal peptide-containing protein [bacterium]|nr:SipW-dependent-type signal peptide-containing protein [bacterium]
MKKIILSVSVIAAVAAIAIGGTYAYFSVTKTSTGNTFNAATMTMELNDSDNPTPGPALYAKNFYPGAFAESAAKIAAVGVGVKPELSLTSAVDADGMADYLWLEVWTNGKLWYSNFIKQFPGYGTTNKVVLDPIQAGATQYVAFRVLMLESAPNSVQGKTYSVNVVITGHQWNDPSYPVSSTVDTGAGKYVANTWSYNVCGVRQPGYYYAVFADGSNPTAYDYATYSPYFSYSVQGASPWGWKVQAPGDTDYAGGKTHCTSATDCYCTVK